MSNHITIELCAEDRERLDRLIAAMERKACDKCVKDARAYAALVAGEAKKEEPPEALENATETAKAPTLPTAPAEAERPAQEETAPAPAVTKADVQKKIIELASKNEETKAAVRAVVKQYAERVQLIPEDKLGEVLAKLNELRV